MDPDWESMSEGRYFQECMELLRVQSRLDTGLVADDECYSAPCTSVNKVAFHPYGKASDYLSCWEEAAFSVPLDEIDADKDEASGEASSAADEGDPFADSDSSEVV